MDEYFHSCHTLKRHSTLSVITSEPHPFHLRVVVVFCTFPNFSVAIVRMVVFDSISFLNSLVVLQNLCQLQPWKFGLAYEPGV